MIETDPIPINAELHWQMGSEQGERLRREVPSSVAGMLMELVNKPLQLRDRQFTRITTHLCSSLCYGVGVLEASSL